MVPFLELKAKIDLGLRNPSMRTPILNASAAPKAFNKIYTCKSLHLSVTLVGLK